jgi:predicted XRE-type DNA-binding protein
MRRKIVKQPIDVTKGSGNVFADLALENPEELSAKSEMIYAINEIIKSRDLKQAEVAKLVGLTQSDISMLTRGRLRRFSTDRIMQVLLRLGQDVEIVIKPKSSRRTKGRITVKAA